jgi:hypothetical protein
MKQQWREEDREAKARQSADRYFMDDYQKLVDGMNYLDAVIRLGSAGEELSSAGAGRFESNTYSWRNPNGSSITATFQDSRLVAKAQFGLKYR